MAGEPFVLLPWMKFLIGSLFGWWRITPEGQERWRFDEVWLETGKGAGKSPLMAATRPAGDRRAGPAAGAGDRHRAERRHGNGDHGRRGGVCAIDHPGEDEGVTLESQGKFLVRGEGDNAHKIEHVATGSVFKTMSGKATQVSGPRPTACSSMKFTR